MATEAILSVFLDKLAILLIEEAKLFQGVHDQVEWIEKEMRQMHSFLRDVEERQITSANVRTWVADIQELAYDAEDLIDTFIINKEQQRRGTFFKRYALIFRDILSLRKFGKGIERIQANIRSLSDRRVTYGIQSIGGEGGLVTSSSTERLRQRRQTTPYGHEMTRIVGLEEDIDILDKQLVEGDLALRVFSIVGMGGLGKTTLAKAVYITDAVKRHFDCFAWVYVSQCYKVTDLLHEIEEQLRKSCRARTTSTSQTYVEEVNLFHFLQNRKYLIVMDDVWTTDVWDSLEPNLPKTEMGSRILLTTRNRDVALHADRRSLPHELKLLSEHESWKLFLNVVFKERSICPPEMEELGRSIVGKCGGLPLAVVLIGGILSTKDDTIDAWSRVFDSLPWQFNQDAMHYSSILALSYYDLPFYLKPCFLYLGIFPEGFQISVKRLIRLWIAEGLVHPRADEELEDVGKDYIEELEGRNIIQVTERNKELRFLLSTREEKKTKFIRAATKTVSPQSNLACRMHDLIRDLSLFMAKKASFLDVSVIGGNGTADKLAEERVRRLAVHFANKKLLSWEGSYRKLRSLLLFDLWEGETQREDICLPIGIINSFELLKVLDLEGTYKPRISKVLGKLIHLRYLGLRRTWIETLPSSVANLFNLQVLDLKCTEVEEIPSGIWGMQQLRHLYLNGEVRKKLLIRPSRNRYNGNELPVSIRTLCGIVVDHENCVKDMLENLTKIRKLGLEGDLMLQGNALVNWVGRLTRLEHLKLRSTADKLPLEIPTSSSAATSSPAIPELAIFQKNIHLTKLYFDGHVPWLRVFVRQFHEMLPNLTRLTLVGSRLDYDPMLFLYMFQNLRTLRLWYNSYIGTSMVCHSGRFPKLEVLELCWLDELEELEVEEGAMPNLKEFEINKCSKINFLPHGLLYMTNLMELRLPAMSDALKSRVSPYTGRDWHKIQHIPFISPPLCTSGPEAAAEAASTSYPVRTDTSPCPSPTYSSSPTYTQGRS